MNLNCGPLQDFLLTKGFRPLLLVSVVMFSAHVCREKFTSLREKGGPSGQLEHVFQTLPFFCASEETGRVACERGDGRAIFLLFVFFVSRGEKMHPLGAAQWHTVPSGGNFLRFSRHLA